jgi:hypothetical protein
VGQPARARSFLFRLGALLPAAFFLTLSGLIRPYGGYVSAGHGYVYFKPHREFGSGMVSIPIAWLLAGALLILSCFLLRRRVRETVRQFLHQRRLSIVVLLLLLLTLVPLDLRGRSPGATDVECAVYLVFGSLGILSALLAIGPLLDYPARLLLRLYRAVTQLPPVVFAAGAALFVLFVANLVSARIFGHMPHIHDTSAQLFQARLFAQGKLFLNSPPGAQFFDVSNIINYGRWYSQYPPGHPFILMLGVLAGAPWAVNPLLGALTVVVIYLLGREVYDDRTARLGTMLAMLSPFLVFMSSEYMNHASSLLFVALFMLLYAKSRRTGPMDGSRAGSALGVHFLAGLCLGMVICIRPLTALLIAIPFAIEAAVQVWRDRGQSARLFAVMAAGAGVMLALLFAYNYLTNGNPLTFGYVVKYGLSHELGFGDNPSGVPYTLGRAIVSTSLDLNALNRYLFEFPFPSLVFIAILFAAGTRERWDCLLIGTLVCLVAGHFCYWFHAIVFGPRWEYEALPALVLLSARGLRALPGFIQEQLALPVETEQVRHRTARLLLLGYASMFTIAIPALIGIYSYGFGVSNSTGLTIDRARLRNAVVMARRYDEVFLKNQFPPGGEVVYTKDLGGLNPLIAKLYPGRRLYWANRDTLRELAAGGFEQSPLKEGLDSITTQLQRMDLSGYRTIIWPAVELSEMVAPMASSRHIALTDYRELSHDLITHPDRMPGLVPALAVWVFDDQSDALQLFSLMDEAENFVARPYRFTLLGTSINGRVALYDISTVND